MAKKNDNGSSDRAGKSGTSGADTSASGSNGSSVGSGGIESESGSTGNGKPNAETKGGISAIDSGRGDKSSGNASAGTSTGTGSDSGSGRNNIAGTSTGTGSEKRKRGRPKGSTNRQRNAEDISRVNAPKTIDTSILGSARKRGKRDYTKPFAKAFKFAYELPRYAGYGEHWPIGDDEANELGSKLNECVDAFPKSATSKFAEWFEKYVDKYMPFAALGITAYVITEPRVQLTKQLIADAKQREQNASRGGNGSGHPVPSGITSASPESGGG
jgi:hypothetical protein